MEKRNLLVGAGGKKLVSISECFLKPINVPFCDSHNDWEFFVNELHIFRAIKTLNCNAFVAYEGLYFLDKIK